MPSSEILLESCGIKSARKYCMDAVKHCRNEDDLCGCPDWFGFYVDTESLHEGIFGHSPRVLVLLVEEQKGQRTCRQMLNGIEQKNWKDW